MVRSSPRVACFSISFPLSDEADFEVAVEVCFPVPRRDLRKLCIDALLQDPLLVECGKVYLCCFYGNSWFLIAEKCGSWYVK